MDLPSMFEQSRSLIAGAKIIIESDGILDNGTIKHPTTPVILSCALAVEICTKLILTKETGTSPKNHNIAALLSILPQKIQSDVVKVFLSTNPTETSADFHRALKDHDSIFIDWRYAFESTLTVESSPSFLYSLAYSLSIYIENNYIFTRNENGWHVAE